VRTHKKITPTTGAVKAEGKKEGRENLDPDETHSE